MQNVLADLAIESEAATVGAMWLARIYDHSHVAGATDGGEAREAKLLRRIATPTLKYWTCKRAPWHAVECLECHGGNGYVEESRMPRLLRESPLQSIWEGSGNVQALDVLRAMVSRPESVGAFLAEVEQARGADHRLDRHLERLRRELGDFEGIETRARRMVEDDGARPPGLAARPLRRPRRRRRLLREPPRRRLGRRLRHPAARGGVRADHRAACAGCVGAPRRQPRPGAKRDNGIVEREPDRNVVGGELQECSAEPLTGFFRDGCCATGPEDAGSHTVCAIATDEFLEFSLRAGNDLSTPRPQWGFPGLEAGDRWCVCAARWLEAHDAGCAPPVLLAATHERALDVVPIETLLASAVEADPATD